MSSVKDLVYIAVLGIIGMVLLIFYWRKFGGSRRDGKRLYTRIVDFRSDIAPSKDLKLELSAKFTFTTIAELHTAIKRRRRVSKDGIVLFRLPNSATCEGFDSSYRTMLRYQWMELTELSHPSELAEELMVHIASPNVYGKILHPISGASISLALESLRGETVVMALPCLYEALREVQSSMISDSTDAGSSQPALSHHRSPLVCTLI